MPKEERQGRNPKRNQGQTTDLPLPPGGMPSDYKPDINIPGGEASVDDYRARKRARQEALGAGGRKQFRRDLNSNWDRIARAYLTGTPLENLIEMWGEGGGPREGRRSVAYDQWTSGNNPGLQRMQYKMGQTKKEIASGGLTEWPPGSGMYFNDPNNDPSKRKWFNQFREEIPAPGMGPEIDYSQIDQTKTRIADWLAQQNDPNRQPTPAPPVTPGTVTSGGVTYNPGVKPTPTPTGPPSTIPVATTNAPSYLTGNITQPASQPQIRQPWGSPSTPSLSTVKQSPYSHGYNPMSQNARGIQYRKRVPGVGRSWRF